MKTINLFLTGCFVVLIMSCQSGFRFGSDLEICYSDIPDFEISSEDAAKEFSHTPTGVVYVETPDKPIKIDFSCDEDMTFQTSDRNYILLIDNAPVINTLSYGYADFEKNEFDEQSVDIVSTLGQLIAVYSGLNPSNTGFSMGWDNYFFPPRNGEFIYSTLEYLLAQSCFQDDCSILTRRAVLKMAIEKQTYKFDQYQVSFNARRTGIFLMASIMAKERYPAFIAAVLENQDLQNAMCFNEVGSRIDKEFSDLVSQFAINFLLNR